MHIINLGYRRHEPQPIIAPYSKLTVIETLVAISYNEVFARTPFSENTQAVCLHASHLTPLLVRMS